MDPQMALKAFPYKAQWELRNAHHVNLKVKMKLKQNQQILTAPELLNLKNQLVLSGD